MVRDDAIEAMIVTLSEFEGTMLFLPHRDHTCEENVPRIPRDGIFV